MNRSVIVVVFVLFCLAPSRQQQRMRQHLAACQRQTKATKADVESFIRHEIPTTQTGNCLLACMFESTDLMKKGKYNLPGALAVAGRYFKNDAVRLNKAKQVVQSCQKEVAAVRNKCEVASKIAHCATRESAKLKI